MCIHIKKYAKLKDFLIDSNKSEIEKGHYDVEHLLEYSSRFLKSSEKMILIKCSE